ncbi:MAG: NERD domain-containing protein [Alteromonadaceae bacterium]|nr:NERD domain-containing protein [Alteromonadaceae bacterium]
MQDLKRAAGAQQESQVSYFLDRYFGNDDQYRILKDLVIEIDGFKSQIDHLVVYKAGFIVIESKSIHGSVRVNSLGEWERSYKDQWFGIPSPVQQAAVQIDNLKALLREHTDKMLGKLMGIQQGFGFRQYKTVIAISSSARLERDNIPKEISRHIVKTEFLVDKIKDITATANSSLKSLLTTDPRFSNEEMDRIYHFLRSYQQTASPQQNPKPAPQKKVSVETMKQTTASGNSPIEIGCKNCGKKDTLSAQYGRFGYYVQCQSCSTNTALKHPCPVCGSVSTKTRKSKSLMYLDCQACHVHTPFAVKWGMTETSG